ncbi:MAG: response regulator [Gemmataceae bacterium]|nr:response regulator [Gemmataceae bacterium]
MTNDSAMKRILLVEDEQVNRELFRRRLERKGYAVTAAEDGQTAVARAVGDAPDLVIMDLGLPDIDGLEAARRIKGDPRTAGVPVIVLSAHATAEARDRSLAAGCQDFETKPVNWDALFAKIEHWLAQAEAALDPDATANLPAPKPARLLVAEDDEANRAMLCRRLNKLGYQTAEAADGPEALAAVRGGGIDLVLCDLMMPGVDGYEVLRALKADPATRDLPVLMVSAVDEPAGVARCIELGADDYLHKPYDPVLLQARVGACLDRRRLRERERDDLRAIAALTRAAELVERGRFDPSVLSAVLARGDALGTLARAFDRMAREVEARPARAQPPNMAETALIPRPPRS